MNSSNYRFTLDMHSGQSQISLPVVLNDTKRKLHISLADGGKLYHIEDGCLALIRVNRPTGTYLAQFCPIEDNTNIVYDFGQYIYTAIVEGLHECEVTLYGLDGGVLTTARFSMVVSERVVNSDNAEVTDENWTEIDSIVAEEAKRQAEEAKRQEAFKTAIDDANKVIDDAKDIVAKIEVMIENYPSGVYVGSGEMPEGYNVQVDPEGAEVENLVLSVNGVKPDENGNVEVEASGGSGVYVGSGEMPEGYNVQVDPEGTDVENLVLSVNGVKADENGNVDIEGNTTIPTDGEVGQVLTKTEDGYKWADVTIPSSYGLVTYNQDKTITIS